MDAGLISKLADQGVLGTILAISLSLNFFTVKLLLAEKDKRREDAINVNESLVQPLNYIKDSIQFLLDAARRKR